MDVNAGHVVNANVGHAVDDNYSQAAEALMKQDVHLVLENVEYICLTFK